MHQNDFESLACCLTKTVRDLLF